MAAMTALGGGPVPVILLYRSSMKIMYLFSNLNYNYIFIINEINSIKRIINLLLEGYICYYIILKILLLN